MTTPLEAAMKALDEWTPELEAHRVLVCQRIVKAMGEIAELEGQPNTTIQLLIDAENGLTLLGDIVFRAAKAAHDALSAKVGEGDASSRVNYLTVSENASLKLVCEPIVRSFPDNYGCFHVGSSLTRKDYRDVDVRLILPNAEFERLFGKGPVHPSTLDLWFLVCWAISEWMQKRTGLPIDFQIQAVGSEDNKDRGPRNALFFGYREDEAITASSRASGEEKE
jgi:hypothetical protein